MRVRYTGGQGANVSEAAGAVVPRVEFTDLNVRILAKLLRENVVCLNFSGRHISAENVITFDPDVATV